MTGGSRRGLRRLALVVVIGGACTSQERPRDGGAADAQPVDAAVEVVAAPLLPSCLQGDSPAGCAELPKLLDWTCPAGWPRSPAFTDEKGAENPPASMRQFHICGLPAQRSCPDGKAQMPGEVECRPLGSACPAEDFLGEASIRALAPGFSGVVRYVRVGASGSGGRGDPLGSVSAGLAAAAAQDIVALSKGSFSEAVVVDKKVAVVGACVDGTAIVAPSASEAATVELGKGGGGARLANLRISGPRIGILLRQQGPTASVAGVEVKKARIRGILATDGAAVELTDVVVRDTESQQSSDPTYNLVRGTGLTVVDGAQVTVARAVFERNRRAAVEAFTDRPLQYAPPVLKMTDVVIRDTAEDAKSKSGGHAVRSLDGAKVDVARGLFERNRDSAITAYLTRDDVGPPTIDLRDAIVRDTRGETGSGEGGFGLAGEDGAQISVARTLFEHNRGAGVAAAGPDQGKVTTVALTDVVVRDTESPEDPKQLDRAGYGLQATSGARLTATRVLLERNRTVGALVAATSLSGPPPQLAAVDLAVRGTRRGKVDAPGTTFLLGIGLQADRAEVSVERALFDRNDGVGISVVTGAPQPPARVTLSDILVRDTLSAKGLPAGAEYSGHAVTVYGNSHVTLARAVLDRNREIAVVVRGAALELQAGLLRDTQGFGMGIAVFGSATVSLQQAVLLRNRVAALVAGRHPGDDGTPTVELQDVVLRETGSDASGGAGWGLAVTDGAKLTVRRAAITANREFGIVADVTDAKFSGSPSRLDLADVLIGDTMRAECASVPAGQPLSCNTANVIGGAGTGISVGEADVRLEGFEIRGSALCAMQVYAKNAVTPAHGSIHHNTIGINVQIAGFDLSTLLTPTVRLFANDVNLQSRDLVLPDPAAALAAALGHSL